MSNVIKFPNMFGVASGKLQTVTSADEAKQCVKCALHSVRGELFGDPEFGSDIREFLYENLSSLVQEDIREAIIEAANKYAKGIEIYSIEFEKPENDIVTTRLSITIYYYLKSLARSDSTTITFI